jgi:F0F1-type ATP synthase delta subunit
MKSARPLRAKSHKPILVQTKKKKEKLRTFLRDSKSKKRSQSRIFFSTLGKEKDKNLEKSFLETLVERDYKNCF